MVFFIKGYQIKAAKRSEQLLEIIYTIHNDGNYKIGYFPVVQCLFLLKKFTRQHIFLQFIYIVDLIAASYFVLQYIDLFDDITEFDCIHTIHREFVNLYIM